MDIKSLKPLTKTELQSIIGGKKSTIWSRIPHFFKGLSVRLPLQEKK